MTSTVRFLFAAAALGAAFDGSPGQVAAAGQRPAAPPAAARTGDRHLPHAALEADLRALAAAHAGSATLVEMGRTAGGRRLWAIEIAAPGAAPPASRPGILLVANLAADQVAGSTLALGIARALLTSSDESVRRQLADQRVLRRAAARRGRHRGGVRAAAGAAARQRDAVRRRQRRPSRRGSAGRPERGRADHRDARPGPRRAVRAGARRCAPDEARRRAEGRGGRLGGLLGRRRQRRRRLPQRGRRRRRRARSQLPAPVSGLHGRRRAGTWSARRNRGRCSTTCWRAATSPRSSPSARPTRWSADRWSAAATARRRRRWISRRSPTPPPPRRSPSASRAISPPVPYQPGGIFDDAFDQPAPRPPPPPSNATRPATSIETSDMEVFRHVSDRYRDITGIRQLPPTRRAAGAFHEWAYFQFGIPGFSTPGAAISAAPASGSDHGIGSSGEQARVAGAGRFARRGRHAASTASAAAAPARQQRRRARCGRRPLAVAAVRRAPRRLRRLDAVPPSDARRGRDRRLAAVRDRAAAVGGGAARSSRTSGSSSSCRRSCRASRSRR